MVKATGTAETAWAKEMAPFGSVVPNIDRMVQASNTLLEAWRKTGEEVLEFGKTRLDHSLAMSRQLAQTTNLREAIELHAQFHRAMVQDYCDEVKKIADLGTRGFVESLSALQSEPPRSDVEHDKAA